MQPETTGPESTGPETAGPDEGAMDEARASLGPATEAERARQSSLAELHSIVLALYAHVQVQSPPSALLSYGS